MDIDEEPSSTKNSAIGAPPSHSNMASIIWWHERFNSLESAYLRDGCDPEDAWSYAHMCMSMYTLFVIIWIRLGRLTLNAYA
ncbi:hypothetical protein FXO38_07334 [Capsicum annuum]|nr:hypothetical protein FXO38_07334 [Capsicum annuum]